jgi:hypothetical protein
MAIRGLRGAVERIEDFVEAKGEVTARRAAGHRSDRRGAYPLGSQRNHIASVKLEAKMTRFFQDPGSSFFLFGPRGTGKSSWLRAAFPEALWLDLLEPDLAAPTHLRWLRR